MAGWILVVAILAAALVCPAMMWLGRRGIGRGCPVCPPPSDDDALAELRTRQRALAAEIDELEARQARPHEVDA